jgi:hypothetical protein
VRAGAGTLRLAADGGGAWEVTYPIDFAPQ